MSQPNTITPLRKKKVPRTVECYEIALAESLKLQSHYAKLLNTYDGGERMYFDSVEEWLMRLQQTDTLP